MYCIRENGHTIGPQPTEDIKDCKTQIEEKCNLYIPLIPM